MISLENLGFLNRTIGEAIVSTYNAERQPNAAPMGVVVNDKEQMIIRPFMTSLTYRNLKTTKCAVVNVASNPELFYLTAFKEVNPNGKMSNHLFTVAKTVDAPRLREAEAFVEVMVAQAGSYSGDRAEFLCDVQVVESVKVLPKVYCRAQFATIEAIVHATRIKPFLKGTKQEQERAFRLIESVNACEDVVSRTAPNSGYSKIMADLTQRINSWRKNSESSS